MGSPRHDQDVTEPDRTRFERIFTAHYPAVLRYARRRTGAGHAEEVVAEVFTIAWQRIDRVPDEALPWLLVSARNVLANDRRAGRRASDKTHRAVAEARDSARDVADHVVERDAVTRAFATLGPADREALRLVAWDGLTIALAAKVAGVSRVAFAARVSRARRRLAKALDEPDLQTADPVALSLEQIS